MLYDVIMKQIEVIAHPGSRRPRVELDLFKVIHVYVREPALEGRANQAVRQALAQYLGRKGTELTLVAGSKSKYKRFTINSLRALK